MFEQKLSQGPWCRLSTISVAPGWVVDMEVYWGNILHQGFDPDREDTREPFGITLRDARVLSALCALKCWWSVLLKDFTGNCQVGFRGAPAYKAGLLLLLEEDHSHCKTQRAASLDSEFQFRTQRCTAALYFSTQLCLSSPAQLQGRIISRPRSWAFQPSLQHAWFNVWIKAAIRI